VIQFSLLFSEQSKISATTAPPLLAIACAAPAEIVQVVQ
jgi:hypothetical protein